MEKTEKILTEIEKRQAVKQSSVAADRKTDLVICMLGDDYYAFEGRHVKEILPYETVNYVPGCPEVIMGIINVRGDIESVLNLSRVMGLEDHPPTHRSRIILAAHKEIRTGILVDRVEDVIAVPSGNIKSIISTISTGVKPFASGGETLYGDHYVTVLDMKRILRTLIS